GELIGRRLRRGGQVGDRLLRRGQVRRGLIGNALGLGGGRGQLLVVLRLVGRLLHLGGGLGVRLRRHLAGRHRRLGRGQRRVRLVGGGLRLGQVVGGGLV